MTTAVAEVSSAGELRARSHGYNAGNWSTHNFYHADGNGNVTALVNSAGTLQASYKYDPYGRYLSQSGALASANVLRFSSKPWVGFNGSTTSGLYAYGYRFYDPYLQRWVNTDPVAEPGLSLLRFLALRSHAGMPSRPVNWLHVSRHENQREPLYVFVHNSPYLRHDPMGLDSLGCDGVPGKYESFCALECCAVHDFCYQINNCSWWSWLCETITIAPSACGQCNIEAVGCLAGCALHDEGFDDPESPNYYCAACKVFFDDPNSPHMTHTTD